MTIETYRQRELKDEEEVEFFSNIFGCFDRKFIFINLFY